ncbi:MAG: tetratricopeptide repeat protein [Candidatus Cloacimonadota bacterium]|nr:tetratricopeptide repeat protein [Candidatus Cloacimonadota bacterium]
MKTKFVLFATLLLGLMILIGCQSQYMTTAKLAIRDEKKPDKAIENLNMEIKTNPQNADAYLLLSKVYGQFKGDYEKSFEYAEKAVEIDPSKQKEVEGIYRTCWSQMHNAGVKEFQKEEYSKALESIQDANMIFPDSVQTIKMLANIYLKMDSTESACEYFKIIIEKEPQEISARKSLAQINFNQDNYEESILYFKQLAELQPENLDWTYNIAACYSNADNNEKAMEYYKITLEKDPENLELLQKIANSEFNSQNYETAAKYYKKAIILDPENIKIVEFCTRSLNSLKDYEGVLEYATKWKELDPNNKNAELFIRLAKQKLGN